MKEHSELRFAVLIDAENVPHSNVKGILEEAQCLRLEKCSSGKCHYPYSTIQLYNGKKLFGLGNDYRCHGYSVF